MISLPAFLLADFAAAALLALWVATRFPRLGPTSMRSALALVGIGLVLVQLDALGVALVVRLPYGAYAALFGCVLPCFFAAFLAVVWLMRLLVGLLGGSGGGGHRVPAEVRS